MIKKYFKNFLLIVLITLTFKPLWVLDNYNLGNFGEDDYSYWLHASTLAFDNDLNYLNDYTYNEEAFVIGKNTPYHPPGAGYLVSFFVKALSIFDSEDSLQEIRLNPIGSISYLGFFLGNLVFLFMGLVFLKKTLLSLKIYHPLLIYLTFLSTLVHFATTRFLMSHVAEFFVASIITYYIFGVKNLSQYQKNIVFLFYFLLVFTRPSTFLYFLILLILKRNNFLVSIKSKITTLLSFFGYLILYSKISLYLYGSYSLLFNPEINKTTNSFFENFEIMNFISNLLNIPNLFLSSNMGIIFSTPVVFIGIFGVIDVLKLFEKKFDKLLILIYLTAPFIIMSVWEGLEVAYGQRLLIGILPIFAILSGFTIQKLSNKLFIYLLMINTYLGYLFFYSTKVLTLRAGTNLWGVSSKFTAENYYLYLYQSIFNLQDIFAAFTKNIYFVTFLRNTSPNLLNSILKKFSVTGDNLNKVLQLQSRYIEFSNSYINTYIGIVFLFSFLFLYFFKNPISKK